MNNVKLTLATTLSVLTLAFSGAASADNGKRFENHKQNKVMTKTTYSKDRLVKDANRHQARKPKNVKRVVVKTAPTKKIVIAKKSVRKPVRTWTKTKNQRFAHVKRFNKQYSQYQSRSNNKNRYNRVNRVKNKQARQATYSVRSGDTLIQISYKTGVSIKQLARLNRIKNRNLNYLQVGQVLRLV